MCELLTVTMARSTVVWMDLDESEEQGMVEPFRVLYDVRPHSEDFYDLVEDFVIMLTPDFSFRVGFCGDQFAVYVGSLPTHAFVAICAMLSLQTELCCFTWIRPGHRSHRFVGT